MVDLLYSHPGAQGPSVMFAIVRCYTWRKVRKEGGSPCPSGHEPEFVYLASTHLLLART